jgi:integrase
MSKANKKKKQSKHGLGRLYKRDKTGKERPADSKAQGIFYLEYRVNGKRTRQRLVDGDGKPITTLREAEKERIRIMAPFASGDTIEHLKAIQAKLADAETTYIQAVDDAHPPLTLANAWEAYLSSTERPDTGEATLKYYAGYWTRFEKWMLGATPDIKYLREITHKMAQDYAATLNGGTMSPNTYNKHTGFLRLFFRVLEGPARMQENPFERIRKKQLKTNVRRELTIAELKDILEKAEGELQTLLMLGTFTGLRLGDCCTLKWSETDLDRGLIRRIPNKTAKSGKPVLIGIPPVLHKQLSVTPKTKRKGYVVPKYATLYTYRNETGKPTRQPDISDEIQKHLRDRCEIQIHKEGTGYKKVPDLTGKHEYIWKYTGKRAVVEVGFHSLRHTYVSLHAEAGTPQAMIQANVGHSNPSMTAHYTHVNEAAALRIAGALDMIEQEPKAEQIPDWVMKKFPGMTKEDWMQIKKESL